MLFYKTYNKKITRWVWDGNTPLHEWIEASGEENKQPEGVITWVFDEGRFCPAARLVGDKAYSIITDYLGTPVQAYNESGKLKWETELDIYGKVRTFEGDKALIPFRYQGQYEDEETGLYYNRFRYYSPDEGIYLSQDPIGLSGGTRLYGYVHNPNNLVDVLGLADFMVSPNGTVVPTNKDINLVSTSNDGDWFQIHFEHEHDGLNPHTHYPEKHDKSTNRRYKVTTADDLDYADKVLKEGKMRPRKNRKDKGGCCL